MNAHIRVIFSLIVIALLSLLATQAWSDDIKSRMLARVPEIDALKADGIVGEDKNGFLKLRKEAAGKQAVVSAENADRAVIYKKIAEQQGVSVDVVGQHRARQIAERAKKGEWLQGGDGNWYQK